MNDRVSDVEELQQLQAEQGEGAPMLWTACVPREENLWSHWIP